MDATELTKALTEWAIELCPGLNTVYDNDADEIRDALPIAVAVVLAESDSAQAGLEEVTLHSAEMKVEFMVDDDEEASEKLEGFVAALGAALREEYRTAGDISLGGRVGGGSPDWQASYEPPFLIFDDTTKARRAEFRLTVAELL